MENRYDFVVRLAKEAGERILKAKERGFEVSLKNNDPQDILTEVDLDINKFVMSGILAKYPEDQIYSEESGGDISSGSFWSVDPIDGTSNFARSIPHFAIVISWMENGVPATGAIYNPVTQELFSFDKDRGSFLNGKEIRVSNTTSLKEAYVLLHIGRKEEIREWGINLQKVFLAGAKKNINLGSSALDLAFLAAGRVDVVIYGTMTTADIACATALVRASGGEVYSIDGTPIGISKTPQQIIATSTKSLFEEISKI